jgi:hypothetical protein
MIVLFIYVSCLDFAILEQLPADTLGTVSCKRSNFRKRIRKVINKVKVWGVGNVSASVHEDNGTVLV